MSSENLSFLSEFLLRRSGLVAGEDKSYLIEARLVPVARRHGLASVAELAAALRARSEGALATEIVEAMTTNETFFFRDGKPFDLFRTVAMPRLAASRLARQPIRVWSAACSTGQEPYSIAMLAREQPPGAAREVKIVATDLSHEVLDKARRGCFTHFEVQRGLPTKLLIKYFKAEGDKWRIDPAITSSIDWRPFNLLDSPAALGRFDVVFCRNVLIYFDVPTKRRVLERICSVLAPDGLVFLGAAETAIGMNDILAGVSGHPGLYMKAAHGSP